MLLVIAPGLICVGADVVAAGSPFLFLELEVAGSPFLFLQSRDIIIECSNGNK